MNEEPTEERPIDDAKTAGPEEAAAQAQAYAEAQEAMAKAARERGGLCAHCGSIVPLGDTHDRQGQRFHRPGPVAKGFGKRKASAVCGPVLTVWRYRVAYVAAGEHRAQCLDLPWPLRHPHNFEMLEKHLAETDSVDRVTVLWYHLLHSA